MKLVKNKIMLNLWDVGTYEEDKAKNPKNWKNFMTTNFT